MFGNNPVSLLIQFNETEKCSINLTSIALHSNSFNAKAIKKQFNGPRTILSISTAAENMKSKQQNMRCFTSNILPAYHKQDRFQVPTFMLHSSLPHLGVIQAEYVVLHIETPLWCWNQMEQLSANKKGTRQQRDIR